MRLAGLCLAVALSGTVVSGSRAAARGGRTELRDASFLQQGMKEEDADPEVSWPVGPLLLPLAAALLALRGAQPWTAARWLPSGLSGDVSLGLLLGLALRALSPTWSVGGALFATAVLPGLVLRTWDLDLLGAGLAAKQQPLPWLVATVALPLASAVACGQALQLALPLVGAPLRGRECTLVFACLNVNGGGAVARLLVRQVDADAVGALLLLWWLGMGLTGPVFRGFAEDRHPVLGLASDVAAGVVCGAAQAFAARAQLRALRAKGSDRAVACVLVNAYACFGLQAAASAAGLPSAEVLSTLSFVACLKHLLEPQGFDAPLVPEAAVSETTAELAAWSDTVLFTVFGASAAATMTFRELQVGLVGASCVLCGSMLALPFLHGLRTTAFPSVARLYCARNAVWVACHAHPRLTLDSGERLWVIALVIHALSIAAVQFEQVVSRTWYRKEIVSELGAELL